MHTILDTFKHMSLQRAFAQLVERNTSKASNVFVPALSPLTLLRLYKQLYMVQIYTGIIGIYNKIEGLILVGYKSFLIKKI